uniref:Putative ribonuclease H-like domain-containing protein n=1 Tax=Tanacetum cinerariifolium TaxID=118510 RepID=A0A699HVM4_TANCI|nr:putative ribonuclease H-like domain-containing protein [Tanacetum cinerariifolium]
MCDKKNSVLFTKTECLDLSPNFKLLDESQVLLRIPKQSNMYSFDLQNGVPSGDLTCLFAKASIDESNLWHRSLGHVNFKTMKKLVKGNLLRGLPSKIFKNDHTCVACQKGKQHKATYSLWPITFWAEAVNTACYILNKALVTKPHNKTPYELLNGRSSRLDFMRPFGCLVTILNTVDPLGKFEGKADEGFLVGYSVTSTQDNVDAGKKVSDQDHIMLPLWFSISYTYKSSDDKAEDDKPKDDNGSKTVVKPVNKEDQAYREELDRLMSQEKEASDAANSLSKEFEQGCMDQRGAAKAGSTNNFNNVINPIQLMLPVLEELLELVDHRFLILMHSFPDDTLLYVDQDDSQIPDLKDTTELRKAGFNNMESSTIVSPIPTHRVYMNKKDERGIVVRNKARLVAQGHRQEEGIDYDEVFASLARIEAIRIFLAFASFMGFIVYQMDVKSAFLYGTIEKEVYVSQPPGFIDPQFPNKVYKVEKALYDLHQAPRACYETLSTFLLLNRYRRGIIDKTLFIKTDKDDIMLVQVYVDDIIFGSTKKSLCDKFEALMHKRFQMSSIRELTFILGLQVKHSEEESSLVRITSRPDIMFVVCAYSRFQVTPKLSHLYVVKRIFRYLKGQPKLGLWYPRDSPFDLEAYSDSDYAGANLDRKSTT